MHLHCIFTQPKSHPAPEGCLSAGEYTYEIFIEPVKSRKELADFVFRHSNIVVCEFEKYTLEEWEKPISLIKSKYKIINKNGRCDVKFENEKTARTRLYYRKPWSFYLERAAKHAEKCQQKSGTHTESWYGFLQ
ncbi:MAG: hypothetical protein LIO43_03310 [Clostridiales bacterium]|nr:hypothetical protein [Clostridiales bacterium]